MNFGFFISNLLQSSCVLILNFKRIIKLDNLLATLRTCNKLQITRRVPNFLEDLKPQLRQASSIKFLMYSQVMPNLMTSLEDAV